MRQAASHRHAGQRHLTLAAGSDDTGALIAALGAKMTAADVEMVITHVDVSQASLEGAVARGMASTSNVSGWNHTGSLVIGTDTRLIAAIGRATSGLRYYDLHRIGPVPLPGSSLAAGLPVQDLSSDLPAYLRQSLGIPDLKTSSLLRGLRSTNAARLVRFATTEQRNSMLPGQSGGYSLLLAPS